MKVLGGTSRELHQKMCSFPTLSPFHPLKCECDAVLQWLQEPPRWGPEGRVAEGRWRRTQIPGDPGASVPVLGCLSLECFTWERNLPSHLAMFFQAFCHTGRCPVLTKTLCVSLNYKKGYFKQKTFNGNLALTDGDVWKRNEILQIPWRASLFLDVCYHFSPSEVFIIVRVPPWSPAFCHILTALLCPLTWSFLVHSR